MLRLGDHVRCDLGIAVVLIAEALGVEVDHDAAALGDRQPALGGQLIARADPG